MKTLTLFGTVALLSATSFLSVSSFAEENRSRYDRAEEANERGEEFGKRGPGRRGRRGDNSENVIAKLDSNDDGLVDEIEFLDSRLDRVENNFAKLDENEDGLISREEAEPRRQSRFEIDREEVLKCVRETYADWEGPTGLDERFDAVDTDGDGYISMTELSVAQEERAYVLFARLDADDDNNVSLEELQASQQTQFELRRALRHCAKEQSDPFNDSIL